MSTKKTRRKFSTSQKAALLRQHLKEKVAISDLCDENAVQPSVVYGWQSHLFDNLEAALEAKPGTKKVDSEAAALKRRIADLEAKLAKKDNVIAEISAEYVALKKEIGER